MVVYRRASRLEYEAVEPTHAIVELAKCLTVTEAPNSGTAQRETKHSGNLLSQRWVGIPSEQPDVLQGALSEILRERHGRFISQWPGTDQGPEA